MKKLLSVDEVSERLGVNRHRLYELCRQNILPHVRLGRQIRFSSAQIEQFIEQGGQAFEGGWRKEAYK